MPFCERYQLRRVINAIGTPTIVGANVAAPEVIAAAAEALSLNVEIDELQRAACRVIARVTGAEAGCVTSSASSGLAIAAAAAMTGADLARIVQLPDTAGLRNEIILQHGHDINFGGRISQMVRLSGARIVTIGTANHCDRFHLRGALAEATAAVLYVVNGDVPEGHFLALEAVVEMAAAQGVPVLVDAAAEPDVRVFLRAGASLVIASGHKALGAPTSGLLCGRKDLVRACYLQNWGIGRAMKVGKEGIAGLMVALERYYERPPAGYDAVIQVLRRTLTVRATERPHRVAVDLDRPARPVANFLRERNPPIWVNDAVGNALILDLRALRLEDAEPLAAAISSAGEPREDLPYHDLYWSEPRLLAWPD
ncbi:MAG: hypothetical protein HYR60_05795 [Acidobacteria bacterium]|nr:hypothetical protein [Acidobacteriota bacterium]